MTDVARRRWHGHPALIWAAIGVGHLLLLLFVYHRVWWSPPDERLFFGWDCLRVYWQDLVFAADALEGGELPLWNPYVLMGYSFHSEPQTGLYSPVNWLLWLIALVSGSRGAWLIQAKVLITMWLGLMGMHLWIWKRHRSHTVAGLAAIIFVFGSPLLVFKNSALLWPVLYLPFALLALEVFVAAPTLRRGAWLAGAVWLCGGAGSPQGFFFCLLILASYYLFSTLSPGRGALDRLRTQLPGLALGAAMTLLFLLPVYLPAWRAMPFTPRQTRSLNFLLAQPLPPKGLGEFLLAHRDTNWFLDLYMGSLSVVLAVYALITVSRRTMGYRLFWLGVALFGVVLSMGRHMPVLPYLIEHVPGFDLFRIPYRYKLLAVVGIVALASSGLASLMERPAERWRRLGWLALLAVWVAYVAAASAGSISTRTPAAVASAQQTLLWAGLGATALTAFAWIRPRFRAPFGAAAIAFLFIDLWLAGEQKIEIMERPPEPGRDLRLYRGLDGLSAGTGRIYQRPTRFTSIAGNVREFSGYYTFPMRLERYDHVRRVAPRKGVLLQRFNVRWVQGGYPRGLRRGEIRRRGRGIYEIRGATPLIRVYARGELMSSRRMVSRLADPTPLDTALIDPADRPPLLPRKLADPIDGRVIRYGRNRIVLEVETPWPGVAVVNEAFFPGWEARVNGKPARLFRANYLLRGVVVPRGRSRIELTFAPRGLGLLLAGFFIAFGILLFAFFGRAWPGEP